MGWWSYSDRRTVEECKSITTKFLNGHSYFDGGIRRGSMNWSRNGEQTGDINFVVSTAKGDEFIRFRYTVTDRYSGEKTEVDYKARLDSTPCHFGGRRWWFICPLIVSGRACNRRVGALYSGDGVYFGCRHCHDLTYQSSKQSHPFDRMFLRMGVAPKTAKQLFKGGFKGMSTERKTHVIAIRVPPAVKKHFLEEAQKREETLTDFLFELIVAGWNISP